MGHDPEHAAKVSGPGGVLYRSPQAPAPIATVQSMQELIMKVLETFPEARTNLLQLDSGRELAYEVVQIPRQSPSQLLGLSKPGEPESTLDEWIRFYILEILRKTGGNKRMTAKVLGIDRYSLYRKMKRLGLDEFIKPRERRALQGGSIQTD